MDMRSIAARLFQNRDGGAGIMLALFLSLSVGFTALAVDIGALHLERRVAQGAADLAAIAAASDLDRADAAAAATLAANGIGAVRSMAVVKGRYDGDPGLSPAQRFVAGKEPFNAVRLDVRLGGQLYFASAFMAKPEISVSAIGAADATATFSIGSRLASVRGGLANALLGALIGGSVNLSAMDYQALLDANVPLGSFLAALATEIGVTAGTYGDVLAAQADVGTVLSAAARASTAAGQAAAAGVLTRLAQTAASGPLPLASLVDLGPLSGAEVGQPHAGLGASVNVMSLVSSAAGIANGGSQVAVTRAAETYRTTKELENAALRSGLTLTPALRVEILALSDAVGRYAEAAELATEAQRRMAELHGTLQSAFSSFATDVLKGESALRSLGSALDRIADRLFQSAGDDLFNAVFGKPGSSSFGGGTSSGLLGGMLIPGILHDGGIAGNDNVPTRPVSAAMFANAPRYHNGGIAGLRPNEVPAILERGERVIPNGQSAAGSVTVPISINIDATGADASGLARVRQELASLKQDLPRIVVPMVVNAMDRNVA